MEYASSLGAFNAASSRRTSGVSLLMIKYSALIEFPGCVQLSKGITEQQPQLNTIGAQGYN
jgi:hypothetical protein